MDFSYEVQKRRLPAEVAKQIQVESPVEASQTADFSEPETVYDEEGYNRDGYDHNGYHRSELEENEEYRP